MGPPVYITLFDRKVSFKIKVNMVKSYAKKAVFPLRRITAEMSAVQTVQLCDFVSKIPYNYLRPWIYLKIEGSKTVQNLMVVNDAAKRGIPLT